jgi:hypothetical protein
MVRPQLLITKDHVVGKATIFVIGQYYCSDGLHQVYSLLMAHSRARFTASLCNALFADVSCSVRVGHGSVLVHLVTPLVDVIHSWQELIFLLPELPLENCIQLFPDRGHLGIIY